jgi:hypothetical protein
VSQGFVPLSLKAVKSILVSPENRAERVFSMSYQKLLPFCTSKGASVTLLESLDQIRAADPGPVWVSTEIGNAHIPVGKLKVYDTCPGSGLANEPVSGAIVSVARERAFALKRRYQVVGSLNGSPLIGIDGSRTQHTLYLAREPLRYVLDGIPRVRLGARPITQAWAKVLAWPQIVEGYQRRASFSPDGPLLSGRQSRILHNLPR